MTNREWLENLSNEELAEWLMSSYLSSQGFDYEIAYYTYADVLYWLCRETGDVIENE